jgi:lysyl-tRNA synthetase class 2
MATLKELRDERLRKLQELRNIGINPYPAASARTHVVNDILTSFDKLQGQSATLTGRITNTRKFGKIAFFVLRDASGLIQLFLKHDTFEQADPSNSEIAFEQINLLDPGDFIEATGQVIKTQTGEISIEVKKLRLLTKSLRPLPTEQEGFTDKEQRLRRRYVDLAVNQDVRERFIRRSRFWQATRDFLNSAGFIEINTPVLEQTTGGADANPFITYMDALNQDFYLRISQELPLKRLVGGGYEKVYDIGPRFRNENYSDEHLPEHVAMEWYWSYADWNDGMRFTQDQVRYVADKTWGKRTFKLLNGQMIDLGEENTDWPRVSFVEIMREKYDIDVFSAPLEQIQQQLRLNKLEVEKHDNRIRGIDKLWKKIRVSLSGPAFLVDIPAFLQPLAKTQSSNAQLSEQFNLILGGTEAVKAYSELNNPVDQLGRFLEQQAMRDAGDDEAQMLDIDFVEMLEYGMPPACGLGYTERLFWILEGVTAREGVIFPQLRREIDEVTRSVYPEVFDKKLAKTAQSQAVRSQDFGRKIVSVVSKDLQPWQVANAVAHMNAIMGNKIKKEELVTADNFISADGTAIPRNPQYAIIVKRAEQKELHKLYGELKKAGLLHHVFIKEMQDTTNDQEITERLSGQTIDDTIFYGVTFIAENEQADLLTKNYRLWN